jgi:hypothetical protein
MAERAFESSGLPHSISEIAALLNSAIEDGCSSATRKRFGIGNERVSRHQHFQLNRSHALVAQTLTPPAEEPAHQEEQEAVST